MLETASEEWISFTERIFLYDWSTASYPYGSFFQVSSLPTPTSMTTTIIPLGNIANLIDPERTMYLLIETSNNMPSGSQLQLDFAQLRERPF